MPRKYSERGSKTPDTLATDITCCCPKCGLKYTRKVFFTGKEPARIYCEECHRKMKRIGG